MKRLRILFFQADYSGYGSAYYQHHFYQALCRAHQVFAYGPGYDGYDRQHTIDDVLARCPFCPDLICFGAAWEWEGPWGYWGYNPTESDPHPAIRVAGLDIPAVQILNKEYKKLNKKFEFIRANDIQIVFTAHHNYAAWQSQLGVRFDRFPFAISLDLFKDYHEPKRYDLGFSGSLHTVWTDVRARIKERLFWIARVKMPSCLERWVYRTGMVKRPRYWGRRIYWGEWGGGAKTGEKYARLINSGRIWLATTSALDLVGTRFYEVMASRSLLFCNRSPVYEGLFDEDVHCIMFENDLSDFDDKLFWYLKHRDEREAMVKRAYRHVRENHTWDRRVEQFTEAVKEIL